LLMHTFLIFLIFLWAYGFLCTSHDWWLFLAAADHWWSDHDFHLSLVLLLPTSMHVRTTKNKTSYMKSIVVVIKIRI
jgi:hypothetical protein